MQQQQQPGTGITQDKKPTEVGNLSDFQDPESITNQMSRGNTPATGNDINVKAIEEGVRAELKRYKTVAKRGLKRDGDALSRQFVSDIIPVDIYDNLTKGLESADTEEMIEELFVEWLS